MKKLILIAVTTIFFLHANARTIISATNNGLWTNASNWSLNRVPANNDSIVIPSGKKITVNNSLAILNNVRITVQGTLEFINIGILFLDVNSDITILSTGKLTGTGNNAQYIFINFVPVWSGITLTGPALANSTRSSFFNPLPVKFISFTLSRNNIGIMIQWSTSEEMNSGHFEVERSTDGTSWNTIANINASGNSSSVKEYSFIDKNNTNKISYYRIKQIDINGTFVYTSVKTISYQADTDIKISFLDNSVFVQFAKVVKGNVSVRFVSLSGQVVSEQILTNPVGQIILAAKASLKGNYIVSVSNDQDLKIAKQIIL
jgi:hypothetical protein